MNTLDVNISRACAADDLNSVRDLLGPQSNISALRIHGTTLLHLAILNGSEDIAKYALEHGVDVNATTEAGCTPLHWAARTDLIEIAQLLIENGAAPNARTSDTSETPCDFAISNGRKEMVSLLESHGGTRTTERDRETKTRRTARKDPVAAFGQGSAKDAVSSLVALLQKKAKRQKAARSLALIGDKAALTPLLNAMEDVSKELEEDGYAIPDLASIIESIGCLGDSGAASRIVKFLDPSYYDGIRKATLKALIRIGDSDCVTALQTAYDDAAANGDDAMRAWAIGALCSCGDESVGNDLLAMVKAELALKPLEDLHGGDLTYRYDLASALGATGKQKFCDFAAEHIRNLYLGMREEMPPASQTHFPRVLGDIGTTKAIEFLREILLAADTATETRDAAAEALAQIGSPRAVDALVAAIASTCPDLVIVESDVEKADGYSAIEEIMPESYYVALSYLDNIGYKHGIIPAVRSRVVKTIG
jgi:HEAT repeat protein